MGAYLRPLEDARRAEVRFATECLAFANVPEHARAAGRPDRARASPRVEGAHARATSAPGWDFDDVRDHYLGRLFGVDPVALRYADHDRYLALGRVVTGEVMAQVFGEWRRARSTCRGALVWFLRDLWPGAGWGVVDAAGAPKAAWYHLKRALQPRQRCTSATKAATGLRCTCATTARSRFAADLELTLYRAGEIQVDQRASRPSTSAPRAAPRAAARRPAFDGFLDLGYAYRFGPPSLRRARRDAANGPAGERAGARRSTSRRGLPAARELDVGLTAEAAAHDGGATSRRCATRRFAQSIAIEAAGFEPDDAYFHLAPGGERSLRLRRVSGTAPRAAPCSRSTPRRRPGSCPKDPADP